MKSEIANRKSQIANRFFVGTSGFSYADWVGHFYPPGMKKGDWVQYYSLRFNALEINYTYYRLPSRRTMQSLVDKCEGRVRFAVKLTEVFTHSRTAGEPEAAAFLEGIAPLAESGTLGPLLAQFPYSFKPDAESRSLIAAVVDRFKPFRVVVEIRNAAWISQDFFSFLKGIGAGFCCVDEPRIHGLLPPLNVVTAAPAYLRFHGRNAAKWWHHDRPEQRYDYLYSPDELREWVPRIRRMADESPEVYVFFNNHFEGKAPTNAQQLVEALAEAP